MNTLKFPAKIEYLPQWMRFIDDCVQGLGLPSKRIHRIELALEEALVNVCNYAYPTDAGEIEITCWMDAKQRFIIEIVDSGLPFNPLAIPTPDLQDDLAHRQVGGLGVFLMRRLMDEVEYRREDGRNILRLVVHLRREL